MINANTEIFKNLDEYCESREDPISNAGEARWIATEPKDREILKNATLSGRLFFSPRRGLARFDNGTVAYFCAIGFDYVQPLSGLTSADLNAGLLTAVLYELKVQPRATTVETRNIVEVADKTSAGYTGHDPNFIQTLYPIIDVLEGYDIALDETWRVFFLLCVAQCRRGETWVQLGLADALQMLADLPLANVPYQTLRRSIFDSDPAALFLALYRCLEALYAYSSSREVIDALKLKNEWEEVAAVLEDALGWHPREENSLTSLFTYGAEQDHVAIFTALGEPIPDPKLGLISAAAGRRIYKLRNDLVHFRPSQARVNTSSINWNMLCVTLATFVCYIYHGVF